VKPASVASCTGKGRQLGDTLSKKLAEYLRRAVRVPIEDPGEEVRYDT